MAKNFEENIKRLEEIVDSLSAGEVPLEDSVKLFSEGVKIAKETQKILNDAEGKIKEITESGTEDFTVD